MKLHERIATTISAVAWLLVVNALANAQFSGGGASVSPDQLAAAQAALQAQITPIQTWQQGTTQKASAVPTSGPGAGLCQETIVPSNIVSSAGVAGTSGSCSLIVMCGTSSAYVVKQINVGGGC